MPECEARAYPVSFNHAASQNAYFLGRGVCLIDKVPSAGLGMTRLSYCHLERSRKAFVMGYCCAERLSL